MRLRGRNVLVTGGAGFLGTHMCRKLVAEGASVRALDVCADTGNTGRSILPGCDLVNGNVACRERVREAAAGVDTIVHMAFPMALRQRSVEAQAVADITAGLINLINAALERGALLIYISSIAVYGNGRYVPIDENHPLEPVLLHGAVKLAGENFCRAMTLSDGLQPVILRVADIFGPQNARLNVPIRFLLQAMLNRPITVYGDGSDSRTYTYVDDFTEAVVLSMIVPGAVGGIFNIGGDRCVSMLELAATVRKITGAASPVTRVEQPGAGRKLDISSQKAQKNLGFKPVYDIAAGLTRTYEWLRNNPDFYQFNE